MKDRVEGLAVTHPGDEPPAQTDPASDPDGQRQALQVLTLAQRTAAEHVAGAQQHAARIHAVASAKAEQIIGDAQARAEEVRGQAETTLLEARATAVRITRDAQGQGEQARRTADKIVSEARAEAAQIARDAQAYAEELKRQAQQRYDDVVGGLSVQREALQQQIEALEHFDHDYRARLTGFMQTQLRALWVDEPSVTGDIEQPFAVTATRPRPVLQSAAVATIESLPVQRDPAPYS